MAARLTQALSKLRAAAEPAWNTASKEVVKQYSSVMEKNAEYVVKDKAAADKLLKQYVFTNLAK